MKPMMIIPPDTMSVEDIALLRENGICVVVSKHPEKLKFVDPLPAMENRTQIQTAAIRLSRMVINGSWKNQWNADTISQQGFCYLFVKLLAEGTELSADGTRLEQEEKLIDLARRTELDRIAREEVRAEQKARKDAKMKSEQEKLKYQTPEDKKS